ncbi:MAG: sialidase family protein [Daejeonella sp.]|nr:sialidase family protein [Daejeonella sp.]
MNKLRFVILIGFLLLPVLLSAQSAFIKVREELIFQDVPFAQCHASTLLETSNGEILAAWFGGTHEGNKDVKIWTSANFDGKWTVPKVVAEGNFGAAGTFPLWNPVLFRNSAGKIFLFYKAGPNPREWWGMYKTSQDRGKTWSEAIRLPDGILGPIKNKPVQLMDGTILSPSSTETMENWKVHIERSIDQGKTWQRIPVDPDTEFGVIQPSILTYPDGRLQILCRSKEGNVIESWSDDNGLTWSKMKRTVLLNPNSGTDAVTLNYGSQLIVYNPLIPGKEWFNGRFKLTIAQSSDGAKWKDVMILEDGTKEEYSYPAIIQTRDGRIHISYTFDRKNIKYLVIENN